METFTLSFRFCEAPLTVGLKCNWSQARSKISLLNHPTTPSFASIRRCNYLDCFHQEILVWSECGIAECDNDIISNKKESCATSWKEENIIPTEIVKLSFHKNTLSLENRLYWKYSLYFKYIIRKLTVLVKHLKVYLGIKNINKSF